MRADWWWSVRADWWWSVRADWWWTGGGLVVDCDRFFSLLVYGFLCAFSTTLLCPFSQVLNNSSVCPM